MHAWDPLSEQYSKQPGVSTMPLLYIYQSGGTFSFHSFETEPPMQVLADPESPAASRPPLIFVDEKVSRESSEEVANLLRSVSIAVFLRMRLELLGLQGIEYGDPKTLESVFGKSTKDFEPQQHLIKLLSEIALPQPLTTDLQSLNAAAPPKA